MKELASESCWGWARRLSFPPTSGFAPNRLSRSVRSRDRGATVRRRSAAFAALIASLACSACADVPSDFDDAKEESPPLAQQQVPRPEFVPGKYKFGGPGCPSDKSVLVSYSNADQAIIISPLVFRAALEPGQRMSEVKCAMQLSLLIPNGWAMGIAKWDFSMLASLPQGTSAKFNVAHQFAGGGAATTPWQPIEREDGRDGVFNFPYVINDSENVFSSCGDGKTEQVIGITMTLHVENDPALASGPSVNFTMATGKLDPNRADVARVSPSSVLDAPIDLVTKWKKCSS